MSVMRPFKLLIGCLSSKHLEFPVGAHVLYWQVGSRGVLPSPCHLLLSDTLIIVNTVEAAKSVEAVQAGNWKHIF